MNITDELRKLADLRAEGNLTEEEFIVAKRRLLAADPTANPPPIPDAVPAAERPPAPNDPIPDQTYRSSRWSAGNLFFPDSLTLAADGLLFRKRRLFGSREENISYHAIASVRVKNGLFLASLSVETSGGSQPIFINGLWKSDAREIQETIRLGQQGAR